MPAKKIRRKDLKQQDEFMQGATRFTHWVMQRRKALGLALLIVIAVASIVAGVWSYRQRQEENAAARLAAAMTVYEAPVAGQEGSDTAPTAAGQDAPRQDTPGQPSFPTEQAKDEAAVEEFRRVVEEYGGYPSGELAAFYLGITLDDLGRVDEALEALERAADADASMVRATARYRLGQLYAQEGRYEEATAAFDRVLEDSPAFPAAEALTAKARTYEAAGDLQAAMVAYQRVADEYPGSVHAAQAGERAEEIAARIGVDLDAEG